MATQTINGKPSIFISAEPPTDKFPTYRDRVSNFTAIAEGMATEGEVNPNQAEQNWLNDSEAQAEYQDWCEKLEAEWLSDPEAQRKFDEWCDEQEQAELETQEHDAYEAHLEAQAETHDLARLGESGMHAIAGHDLIWQAGGSL